MSLEEIGQNQIGMRDVAKCYQKTGFISNDDNMKNQSILTIGKKKLENPFAVYCLGLKQHLTG